MIKRLLIAIVLLALVGVGIVGFNMFRDKAIQDFFANMPVPTATVSTVVAEERSWTPTVEAIGTVNAKQGVDLTVEVAGVIRELSVRANQKIEQGDVLLQLDDATERADLEAGRTQAALDEQSLERARQLTTRGVGTNANLDSAQAAAATSASRVQSAEAVLAKKKLLAPFGGTVGIPQVEVGQYLQPGTVVVTLQDLETMRADFTVPEQRLADLRIDQAVYVTLDGQQDRFAGKITGINPRIDPSSRLVSVRAEIENPHGKLTPGQFARISVELPQEDGVIILPQTAVVTSLYGDYVYVIRPIEGQEAQKQAEQKEEQADAAEAAGQPQTQAATQQASQIFVKLGRRNGAEVEILSGLKVGDQVITAGQNRLNNGSPVAVDNTVQPGAPANKEEASAQ